MTLLEAARAAMERHGWHMYRLSEESGVPYATVHRWIKSGKPIRDGSINRILVALGLDPERMLLQNGLTDGTRDACSSTFQSACQSGRKTQKPSGPSA